MLRAASKLEAPGIGMTRISSSIARFIRPYAGSEIPGVPASEISATDFPSFNNPTIFSSFVSLEYEW